jgi:hypothetical protein
VKAGETKRGLTTKARRTQRQTQSGKKEMGGRDRSDHGDKGGTRDERESEGRENNNQ